MTESQRVGKSTESDAAHLYVKKKKKKIMIILTSACHFLYQHVPYAAIL